MTSPSFIRRIRANAAHLTSVVRAVQDREYRSLDAEWHNFLQAIHTGLEHPEAFAETAALWAALIGFVESRGLFGAWQPVTISVAAQIGALPDELACGIANEAGFFLQKVREYPLSLQMHETALRSADAAGNRLEWALALLGLGNTRTSLRRYDQAEADILKAVAILDELDETRLRYSSAVELLGLIAADHGEYGKAKEWYALAVPGYLNAGHHRKAANSMYNLSITQDLEGDPLGAIETLQAAQALLRPGIDQVSRTNIFNSIGTAYFHLGDFPRAKAAFLAIDQRQLEKHGLLEHLMWTTNNLGNVALKEGDWNSAREYLSSSIELARMVGNGTSLGNSLGDLAEALVHLGERETARAALDEAVEVLENYPENAWARKRLAAILAQRAEAFG